MEVSVNETGRDAEVMAFSVSPSYDCLFSCSDQRPPLKTIQAKEEVALMLQTGMRIFWCSGRRHRLKFRQHHRDTELLRVLLPALRVSVTIQACLLLRLAAIFAAACFATHSSERLSRGESIGCQQVCERSPQEKLRLYSPGFDVDGLFASLERKVGEIGNTFVG